MQPTPAPGVLAPEQAAQAVQPAPAAPPQEAAAPVQATQAPAEETHKSMLLPMVLMGTGGAMVVASVITGIMASGKQSDLEKLCKTKVCVLQDPAQGQSLQSSGQSLALVTDILLFGGIAVAGTGALLFIINSGKGSERNTPPATTASFACLPGLCGGSVRTAF
jgi:hypothetical protein